MSQTEQQADSQSDGAAQTNSVETSTEEVTQTVKLGLETSAQKTEVVRTAVGEFQAMASHMADLMPTVPQSEWNQQNNTFYRMVTDEFPTEERTVGATTAREAAQYAVAMFNASAENGGSRPELGNGTFVKLSHQDFELVANEDGEYGFKAKLIPYNPTWFGISLNPHARRYLTRIFDGEAETGSAELRLEDGVVTAHLVVKWPVEVYEPADVSTVVGVDIGEQVIYAAAAVDTVGESTDVQGVKMESGREFRHYREELKRKRKQLMENDDLRGLKQCRNEHERYTKQVLDTASREIVDFAIEHEPVVIAIEDLTGYRQRYERPIHDWPFADLQEKIAYKAKAEGIPVTTVDHEGTSITCRQCGESSEAFRDGREFRCECGYEVHADVNAAINIATRH